jgi:hypothetical protein
VTFRGHSVESAQTFHFNGVEKFAATLVPVDGVGPTYVERGAVDNMSLTDHANNGQFNFSHVISDNFVAFEDGKVVGSERIRVKVVEHFVGVDTDGDGLEDEVKVDILDVRVSCPR